MLVGNDGKVTPAPPAWTPLSLGNVQTGGALVYWLNPSTRDGHGNWADANAHNCDFLTEQANTPANITGPLSEGAYQFSLNDDIAIDGQGGGNAREGMTGPEFHWFLVARQDGNGQDDASGGTVFSFEQVSAFLSAYTFSDQEFDLGIRQYTGTGGNKIVVSVLDTAIGLCIAKANTKGAWMVIETWLVWTAAAGGTSTLHLRINGVDATPVVKTSNGGFAPQGAEFHKGFDEANAIQLGNSQADEFLCARSLTAPEQANARAYITRRYGLTA